MALYESAGMVRALRMRELRAGARLGVLVFLSACSGQQVEEARGAPEQATGPVFRFDHAGKARCDIQPNQELALRNAVMKKAIESAQAGLRAWEPMFTPWNSELTIVTAAGPVFTFRLAELEGMKRYKRMCDDVAISPIEIQILAMENACLVANRRRKN
jgi:hypothetical protein